MSIISQHVAIIDGDDNRRVTDHVSGFEPRPCRLVLALPGCDQEILVSIGEVLEVDDDGNASRILIRPWSRSKRTLRRLKLPHGTFPVVYNAGTKKGLLVLA